MCLDSLKSSGVTGGSAAALRYQSTNHQRPCACAYLCHHSSRCNYRLGACCYLPKHCLSVLYPSDCLPCLCCVCLGVGGNIGTLPVVYTHLTEESCAFGFHRFVLVSDSLSLSLSYCKCGVLVFYGLWFPTHLSECVSDRASHWFSHQPAVYSHTSVL